VDGERTDVGASTAGRSWAGGEGRLTGEDDETERERARTRETTPTDQPHRAAREREREGNEHAQVCADKRGSPVKLKGRAGADARAGWAYWAGLGGNDLFLFPGIYIAFSIYFL
jgi:hypothetical protein